MARFPAFPRFGLLPVSVPRQFSHERLSAWRESKGRGREKEKREKASSSPLGAMRTRAPPRPGQPGDGRVPESRVIMGAFELFSLARGASPP